MCDIEKWRIANAQLKELKELEMRLRNKLFFDFFDDPSEGVNVRQSLIGSEEVCLKAVHKINRTVDEAALRTLWSELTETGIPMEKLIKYSPHIVLEEYRKLSDKHRRVFDQVLTIKPGAPVLSIYEKE